MQDPTILVIGPGAVGCLLAACMARARLRVCLLDHRPDRAARLHRIRLLENGHTTDVPVAVSADPTAVSASTHVIVCVKAFQTASVAQQIAPFIPSTACLLSLQNGLGNLECLQALACHDIRAAILNAGARLLDEGQVQATGDGPIEIAAPGMDSVGSEWTQIFNQAGFETQQERDVQAMLWRKLILNAAINPLTALYSIPNGMLPYTPEAAALAKDMILEASGISHATGIAIDPVDMHERMLTLCRKTARNHSSMLCDVLAKRPTEIDAINGAIVRHAEGHGLSAPVHTSLIKRFHRQFG